MLLSYLKPVAASSYYDVYAAANVTDELRALTVRQDYSFAREAFNKNGVLKPSEPVSAPPAR